MRRYEATFQVDTQEMLLSTQLAADLARDLLSLAVTPTQARVRQLVHEGEHQGVLALAYGEGSSAAVKTYLHEGKGRLRLRCSGRARPAHVLALVSRHYGTTDVQLDLPWGLSQ